jgi:serine/threonine-protein kinase
MGEVYRGRDLRLNRTVAIKVLSATVAADAEFHARFEREAQAIAALQHPNICTVHDVGHGEPEYLVLEFLEGETLAARIQRAGALDAAATLGIAIQIAGALEAAHRAGIVHRDLKPANIMLVRGATASGQPVAKLLDFGLARPAPAVRVAASEAAAASAATRATTITTRGTLLGTVQYMAPEQVEGGTADARSDLWALGCVMYECLTGRSAFEGTSPASVIGAVLKSEPAPLAIVAPEAPAPLQRVIAACLAKNPDDRWQSAADLRRELEWIRDARPSTTVVAAPSWRPWLAAAAAAIAAALLTWWAVRPQPLKEETLHATLPVTVDADSDDPGLALSPDGRFVAYVTPDRRSLRLRDLRSGADRTLASGREIANPFFAPDGLQVGFVAGAGDARRIGVWGAMERVAVGGGAPVHVVEGISSLKGADWGDDGWIYYTPDPAAGLWRVRPDGGQPESLTTPDRAAGEKSHRRPFVLPGGRAVLFVVGTSRITSFDDGRIEALSLADRTRHVVIEGGTAPTYFPALGRIVYERGGSLLTVPFDPKSLRLDGTPETVVTGVSHEPGNGISRYAVSRGGTLIWMPGVPVPNVDLMSVDRTGRATKVADTRALQNGSISPDGTRLAIDPDGATQQLAIVDLARNTTQQLTYEWDSGFPIWTPDGGRLIYRSDFGGNSGNIYWQAADGSGSPERLTTSPEQQLPDAIAGNTLIYEVFDPKTHDDLWTMGLDDRTPRVLIRTPFNETAARVSPDGRWLAYQSDQSGQWEIYVQAFPSSDRRWLVASGGAARPFWMPGGREIAFLQGRDLMTAQVSTSPAFHAAAPVKLFTLDANDTLLDVAPNGAFLVARRPAETPRPLNIIVNWFAQLRENPNANQ